MLPFIVLDLSALVVGVGALMAFCIGLILPPSMRIEPSSVSEDIPLAMKANIRPVGMVYSNKNYEYNWLVSISWKRYIDINTSWEFFCPGTIIYDNKVLTGNGCLKEHFTMNDILRGQVRSGSQYIFEDGQTHEIRYVENNNSLKSPYKNILILVVYPCFSIDINKLVILSAPPIQIESELKSGSKIYSMSWGGSQIPTEQIRRFDSFHIEQWYRSETVSCIQNLCHKTSTRKGVCCNKATLDVIYDQIGPISGKALILVRTSSRPVLLGLHLVQLYKPDQIIKHDLTYFLSLSEPEFIQWLKVEIPDILDETNKSEVVDYKHTIYSKKKTEDYLADIDYFKMHNPLVKYSKVNFSFNK